MKNAHTHLKTRDQIHELLECDWLGCEKRSGLSNHTASRARLQTGRLQRRPAQPEVIERAVQMSRALPEQIFESTRRGLPVAEERQAAEARFRDYWC